MNTTQFVWTVLFVALPFLGQQNASIAEDDVQQSLPGPFATGQFSWKASQPLVTPIDHGGDHCYSVKDPSIVRHNGRWHLFSTIRSKQKTHQIEYRSFTDWADANKTEPQLLDLTGGYCCAPQIFYFDPQKKWYLIYQVQDPSRKPSLQPVYSTTENLTDPKSWSKPTLLFDEHPVNVKMWIDFWVICDSEKAHLFYTDHAGSMFRMETPIDHFPNGFAESREQLAVTVHGKDKTGPWRLHEANHIYYVKEKNKYLALLEAVRPHPTKRNYWDSRNRFVFAMVADSLEGPWQRVESGENDFIGIPNYVFNEDGSPTKYDQISHPELIRSGFDERLEVKDYHLRMMFQVFDAASTPDNYDYDNLPWELSIMKNY